MQNWSDVESDSIFTSSDDEIEAYDHPGLSNLLEQDIHLTSAEKVLSYKQTLIYTLFGYFFA